MHAKPQTLDIQSLDTKTLVSRLLAAAGDERDKQVDFLLYLAAFDDREAYREHPCGSLWDYCRRVLHLRSGAAGRRIGAMRVLREFPALEAPLRDGRLCLTTVVTLRPVLTRENLDQIIARAGYLSDDETGYLVASLRPGQAPREGIRKLPVPAPAAVSTERAPGPAAPTAEPAMLALQQVPDAPAPPPRRRETLQPVSAELYSLRVDMTPEFKTDLERLRQLRSHAHRDGNTGALLHEAVRCALDHYGKRVGAVEPKRARKPRKAAPTAPGMPGKRKPIPLRVRRAVWTRDGGQCTYVSPDGKRCDCRWQLELDHIDPDAKDKVPTADDLRLRCKAHNILAAEEHYGRELMLRCRGRAASRIG